MAAKKPFEDRTRTGFFQSRIPQRYEDEIIALHLRSYGKIRSRDAMVGILVGEALEARREKAEATKRRAKSHRNRTPKKVRHASQSDD